jgi:uncharacterized protein
LEQAEVALADADFLLEGNRSLQSIINRAYYAMFYATLALLQTTGKVPSKHAGVISLFDTEFVLKNLLAKDLSRDLHKAFELRQASDYRVRETATIEKAREICQKAARFVQAVKGYLLEIKQ